MFLNKILQSPRNWFLKNVIAFLIIRRYDLNYTEDILRYISVRPKGSLFYLQEKLWHLLELPDFCDEFIILRSSNGVEIPLTELRSGNKPENPFVLEIWQSKIQMLMDSGYCNRPENIRKYGSKNLENAICEITTAETSMDTVLNMGSSRRETFKCETRRKEDDLSSSMCRMKKQREFDRKACGQRNVMNDYSMHSRLSCKVSTSSMRFNLPGRKKSKDNFANMLLKIQNDLSILSGSMLDNKSQR